MARVTYLKDLPAEVIDRLVQYIRAGSFPYIAAQACGIPKSTWYRWMNSGSKGRRPYRELWDKVQGAHAEARVVAENAVFGGTPLAWLRYGPGRERPGKPGWTDSKQIELSVPEGIAVTHHFQNALKRAYNSDNGTEPIPDDGGESEMPA